MFKSALAFSRSPRGECHVPTVMIIAGTALLTITLSLVPGAASASSHREAPLIATDPQADNTDFYAFVSPEKPDTVTFVANWLPLQEPNGGPTFYPWATDTHHDINIDNDGDGRPDLTYRWDFRTDDRRARANTFLYNLGPVTSLNDDDLLFRQSYNLTEIRNGKSKVLIRDAPVAPSNVGPASIPDYGKLRREAVVPVGGGKSFVGQADDPFFLDLRVFDLLYGANLTEIGQDTVAGYNVNTIAFQVPVNDVVLRGDSVRNPVIGAWSSTSRRSLQLSPGRATPTGDYVQVSRLGSPLINEVILPTQLKDTFNAISPEVDLTIPGFLDRVLDPEVPRLVQRIYGIVPAPAVPRNDLAEIFLTGIAKNAPMFDRSRAPIQTDLNSQILNADVNPAKFVPSEQLRLNTAVKPAVLPNRLGLLAGDRQGYPNGRRLADDVVDIEVLYLEGAVKTGLLNPLVAGDAVPFNDVPLSANFPYVALPHHQGVNTKLSVPGGAIPQSANLGGAFLPVFGGGGGSGGSGSLPMALVTGLPALVLLGSGVLLLARRRVRTAPAPA